MHEASAFFVTRAKAGSAARVLASMNRASGVICDQRVMLNGFYFAQHYLEHLRRIRYKDPESGKTLVFMPRRKPVYRYCRSPFSRKPSFDGPCSLIARRQFYPTHVII